MYMRPFYAIEPWLTLKATNFQGWTSSNFNMVQIHTAQCDICFFASHLLCSRVNKMFTHFPERRADFDTSHLLCAGWFEMLQSVKLGKPAPFGYLGYKIDWHITQNFIYDSTPLNQVGPVSNTQRFVTVWTGICVQKNPLVVHNNAK